MKINFALFFFICFFVSKAQSFEDVSFSHEGKVMYGRLWLPTNPNPALVVLCPGSGAIDRYGSVHLTGANAQCLYLTVRSLKQSHWQATTD